MDSHTVGIYGVLLAVVMVGVVGLYFTSMASNETSVVYVGGGYEAPSVTAWTPPFYSKLASITKPFMVKGKGVTGLSQYRTGTAQINGTNVFDLRMPKYTIYCNATIWQDNDTATLYTCGDATSIGGGITCDGFSDTTPTTSATCNATPTYTSGAGTYGSFVVCNHGSVGSLNATLLNITLANVTNYNLYLDDVIYNSINNDVYNGSQNKGCGGACNVCPNGSVTNCWKSLNATLGNQTVQECKYFETSGQCLCECFSIHIDDEDDVHQLKNGAALEFVIKKEILTTGLTSPAGC